jgi:hypothetical protein
MTDGVYSRTGERFKSKKAFIQAVKDGEIPILESTSPFNNYPTKPMSQLTPGKYAVVGPDPYTKRNWFASVEIQPGGKILVK